MNSLSFLPRHLPQEGCKVSGLLFPPLTVDWRVPGFCGEIRGMVYSGGPRDGGELGTYDKKQDRKGSPVGNKGTEGKVSEV